MKVRGSHRRLAVVVVSIVGLIVTALVPPAGATRPERHENHGARGWNRHVDVRFTWMRGYDDPATPDRLDRVGVLKIGRSSARNVLVLNPGTSGGATYFVPLAKDIVRATRGRWQVWSVERRENQLEDHSYIDKAKQRTAAPQQVFDYYLGWLTNPAVTDHFQLIPDADVAYARGWGLNVEIQDLHRVVKEAGEHNRRVVMGGHSLGGTITTAYATWDFNGRPGAADLAGLVFIDGASRTTPITAEEATQSLTSLQQGTPWLAFGGIPAPFLGIFSAAGSTAAVVDRNGPSLGQTFALLPANIKPPVPVTSEAQFGYAVSVGTSPPNLRAAQVHAGQLAATGDPRGWDRAGAITPIQRYAEMLSGTGILGHDGSAWYHPQRLTNDAGTVANGNVNPAQQVLGVRAIHGDEVRLPMYAFGAALGGQRVLDATRALAQQSGVADRDLVLVNRETTYSHNDPNSASPDNEFVDNLIPFLHKITKPHHRHECGGRGHCNR